MNILYLIGNGFDINAGLKTRATDFYKYLDDHINDDSYKEYSNGLNIINNDIKESVKAKSGLWSDYELGLGHASELFNTPDEFIKVLQGLGLMFKGFIDDIESQVKSMKIAGEGLRNFSDGVRDLFIHSLTELDQEKLLSVYNGNDSHRYNFVSFNYTSLLDAVIDKITNKRFDIITLSNEANKYKTSWPLHIHGNLEDGEAPIIGLNDTGQITNEKFRNSSELSNWILKSTMNKRLRNQKNDKFNNLIKKAQIICCFGLSIGETDKVWWANIGKWISNQNASNRFLIICKPQVDDSRISIFPAFGGNIIEDEIDKFINIAEISKETIDFVMPKILISYGSKGFDLIEKK